MEDFPDILVDYSERLNNYVHEAENNVCTSLGLVILTQPLCCTGLAQPCTTQRFCCDPYEPTLYVNSTVVDLGTQVWSSLISELMFI